ncbi:MAG: hypothetical protein ICV87_06810, partial [Gemmatimonadetes bacterium]|nr:hypothetical protein [Gemmatimonadota bacterium]
MKRALRAGDEPTDRRSAERYYRLGNSVGAGNSELGEIRRPTPLQQVRLSGFWLVFTGYFLFFTLLFTWAFSVQLRMRGLHVPLLWTAGIALTSASALAVMCLVALALAWHLPLEGNRARIGCNLGLSLLVGSAVSTALEWVQGLVPEPTGDSMRPFAIRLLLAAPSDFLVFTCFMAAGYA